MNQPLLQNYLTLIFRNLRKHPLFGVVGLFILAMSVINFVNLNVAQSIKRRNSPS
ncbi:MAG: hypothetical protein HC880_10940 [Bacteroidia bacterium]|nr:hypothetical protein [Bacteroidia bacterium]